MSAVVKVTRKYQVTIPKKIRERLGIHVGDKVLIRIEGDCIVIKPVVRRRSDAIEEMLKLVSESVDIDAVRLVEESWSED